MPSKWDLFNASTDATDAAADATDAAADATDAAAGVVPTSADAEAAARQNDCVRASHLLGGDPFLTLHGGGNTSFKDAGTVSVKASGFNLATITPEGFAALRREPLHKLTRRDQLTDVEMVAGLRAALIDPLSKDPSIEALLHNLLPHTSVLHSHADAIVTLTNTARGLGLVTEVLGDDVLVLGYFMPGFDLALAVRDALEQNAHRDISGIVLAHHGLFTFGDTARAAYERHIELVDRAAAFIAEQTGVVFGEDDDEVRFSSQADDSQADDSQADDSQFGDSRSSASPAADPRLHDLAAVLSERAGVDIVVESVLSAGVRAFIARDDLAQITQRGPATLEHVIRTKRVPLIDGDLDGYETAYRAYFERNVARSDEPLTMLHPIPRVILDAELGLVTTGPTAKDARIAGDIYRHTMRVIDAAERLGGYVTVTDVQAFDIEYWELEQRKLR